MDEILYLEPDEEITTVIDKMRDLKGKRVGLVIPRGATLLQSIVNLKLLQKEAKALEKELAIITGDKVGRNLSAQLGIAIFDNIEQPRPIHQPAPAAEPPREEDLIELDMSSSAKQGVKIKGVKVHQYEREINRATANRQEEKNFQYQESIAASAGLDKKMNPKKKIIIFIIAIGLAIAGLYLFYPKAEAEIVMETEPYEKEIDVNISTSPSSSDFKNNTVKGEILEVEKSAEKELETSAEKNVGEKAKGELTIFNSWDSNEQSFEEGTSFYSAGKEFKSLQEVKVPGAKAVISEGRLVTSPGQSKIKVESASPGEEYNIGLGKFTIVSLPKNKQDKIYGESSSPMSGGSSKKIKVVGEEDGSLAREALLKELSQNLIDELRQKSEGKRFIDGSLKQEVLETNISPPVGSEASRFKINLKVKNTTIVFAEKEYRQKVIEILKKEMPENKELILTEDDEIATNLVNIDLEQGKIEIKATAKTRLGLTINERAIKMKIAGKSEAEAKKNLEEMEGIKKASINLNPRWWLKKIPSMESNIKLKIKYE